MRAVCVVVALLLSSVSYADEFGGWKFKAPPGTRAASGDHVVFTKITGKTFCQYALFSARVPTSEEDVAQEWQNIVARESRSGTSC